MTLSDPVVVDTARGNVEAQVLRIFLEQEGIEAFAGDDDSIVGLCWFGPMSGIHKPQVWVDRCNADRARILLLQYEDQVRKRHSKDPGETADTGSTEVVCEEWGKKSLFPAWQR